MGAPAARGEMELDRGAIRLRGRGVLLRRCLVRRIVRAIGASGEFLFALFFLLRLFIQFSAAFFECVVGRGHIRRSVPRRVPDSEK